MSFQYWVPKYWPWRCVRLPVLGFVLASSIVILFFDGATDIRDNSHDRHNTFTNGYGAVGVAVGLITFLSIAPMIIIDILRPGYFVSWVVVELAWFTILWILWLATAAVTTASGCGDVFFENYAEGPSDPCLKPVWRVAQAFSYLNWIILMAYTVFLFWASVVRRRRGHDAIWTATVRDTDFLAGQPNRRIVPRPALRLTVTKHWPWKFVRLPVLGFVVTFSAIVLGLGIFTVDTSRHPRYDNGHYGYAAIGVSSITLATVITMLLFDFFRPGTFASWVVVELGWFSTLSLVWLADALVTTESKVSTLFTANCDGYGLFDSAVCQVWKAIQAFAFLNFLFLLTYTCFLGLALSLRKQRGHKIFWTATVRDTDFLDHKATSARKPSFDPKDSPPDYHLQNVSAPYEISRPSVSAETGDFPV